MKPKKKEEYSEFDQDAAMACYWLDSGTIEMIVNLLVRVQEQLHGLVEFSALNKKLKWELQQLETEIQKEMRQIDFEKGFDVGVHLSMVRLAGVDSVYGTWLSREDREKVLGEYQRAAEEYITNRRKKK